MKTYIQLENIVFYSYHGVSEQETVVGNEYIINLKLALNIDTVFETDDIKDTISYADVYESIKEEMKKPSKLIEHAAFRILSRLKNEYPLIEGIELKLSKRNPPMGAQIDYASVILIEGRL